MTRVLVVDDEPQILRGLKTNLVARGYDVDTAPDGEAALDLAARHRPDVVIVDLGLPGIDGVEVIRGLRTWTAVPIIVLSAREQESEKVDALDAGADDYVTKPFGVQELFARIDAVMRRSDVATASKTVCEDHLIRLDPSTREASAANQKLKLSPKEFDLLMYLFKNKERVVPRDELLSRVWNYRVDLNLNSRTVDTHVTRLRRKLQKAVGTDAAVIVAVAKIGYRYLGQATNAA